MLSLGNKLSLTTQPIYKFVNEHSVVFDGTDEYINVNTLAGTMSTGQAFSISVWFKATGSVGGHTSIIFSAHNSSGSNIYRLGLKNSGGIFYAAAVSDTVVGSTNYFDSEWHHLVVTRSTGSSTSTFYVDGVSIGTIANTNPVWDNATQYSIGQEFDGTQATDEFVGNIDELALYDRELTQAEITRMYNTYYSPNRIQNGNFSQIGNEEVSNGNFSQEGVEEVTNGDFSQIGSEQVTNGDFATDSDWTKGSNITISGGSAIFNNAVPYNNLSQNSIFQTGKTYKIEFSVSNFSGGRLIVQESPNVNPPIQEVESNGNYSVFYTATTNSGIVFKVVNGTVNMNLDNVSVKEVGQDWSFGTGWSLGDNKAVGDGTSYSELIQSSILTSGKIYKLTFTIQDYVSGTFRLLPSTRADGLDVRFSGNGTQTVYYESASADLNLQQQQFLGSVTNISVKEVGQDWSVVGSDSTHFVQFTSTGARFVSDTTSPVLELKQTALTSGKNYVLTCNVAYAAGSGAIRFWVGTNQTAFTEGANTKYFTASSTTLSFLRNEADVDCVISNVSVKEVGQHWTVGSFDADNYIEFNGSTARLKLLNTSPVTQLTANNYTLISGTTYKLVVDVASVTSGSIKVDGAGISELFNAAGVTTRTITPTANTSLVFYRASADVDLTLNSVVVQELKHDATNLMLNAGAYQSANPLITSTKSMEFDGVDDYMEVQDDSSLQLEGSEASWTFWTRLDSLSGGDQKFFAKSISGTDTNAYQLRTDNANLLFQFFSGSWRTATSSSFFTDLNWVNVTVTIDSSNIVRIYKNGVETHNSNIGYSIPANTGEMLFGARTPSSPTNFLNGEMTEVGIYNRCLTALEVASLYNQGMPTNLLVNRNNYQSGNPTVFNTKQVDFDGVDDVLNIGNPSVLNFTSDFTISMWIRSNVNTDSYNGLFTKYGGSAGWDLILSSGKVRMGLRGTSTIDTGGGSGSDLRDGNWHHIVAVNTNSDIKLYLDGVLIQTQTGTWTPTTTTNDALIGERGGIPNFDGDISQVGVWTGTLTADEVSSLYNHGLPIDLSTDQAAYASSSNLVGYWRMGSGTLDSYPLIADQTNATLGVELSPNTNFTSNITGWQGYNSGTASWDSFNGGSMKMVNDGTNHWLARSSSNFFLDTNSTYIATAKVFITSGYSGGNIYMYAASAFTGASVFYSQADKNITGQWQDIKFVFATASDGQGRLYFRTASPDPANGDIVYVDDVSLKKVQGNPAYMTNQTSTDIENGSPYANAVQNNNFTTDTIWTKSNATINTNLNKATLTITGGSFAQITQNISYINGNQYRLNATVNGTAGKTLRCLDDGGNTGGLTTSNGNVLLTGSNQNIDLTWTANANSDEILFARDGGTSGDWSVDILGGVTVTEINTGLQGYWKMGDGTNDEYPVIYDQVDPTLSAEYVVNGDFSNGTTGWVAPTQDGAYQQLTTDGLKMYAGTAAGGSNLLSTSPTFNLSGTDGKVYKVDIISSDYVGGSSMYIRLDGQYDASNIISFQTGTKTFYFTAYRDFTFIKFFAGSFEQGFTLKSISIKEVQGNLATMTNMVEGNITNQYPLTKIRNYYRMGDGILDGYPIIQDQTSPNLAHIPTTNSFNYSEDFSQWSATNLNLTSGQTSPDNNTNAYKIIPTTTPGLHTLKKFSVTGQTFSVTAKKGEYKNLLIWSDASSKGLGVNLDDNSIFRNVSILHYNITELTDDWKRIDVTLDASYTGTFAFYVYDNLGTPSITFTGNGSDGLFIYAAQLEEQSQATAYIKSDGIAAVRKSSTTNLIPYSEDFSEWTRTGSTTISATNLTSPIGTTNATRITGLTGSGGNDLRSFPSNFDSANKDLTFSVYLKGSGTLRLQMSNGVDQAAQEIVTLTSDWKRHQVFKDFNSTSSGSQFHCNIDDSGANATSYDIWGAQLEEQTQAETYAPTYGLPVTIDLFTENNYGTMTNMSASDIVEDTP